MKKLAVNIGITAATSLAFTALVPAQEAQAFKISSTYETTLAKGVSTVVDPSDPASSPSIVRVTDTEFCEVGEATLNELRCFVGFDLESLAAIAEENRQSAELKFNVVDFVGGLGNVGVGNSNAGNALTGSIQIGRRLDFDGSAPNPAGDGSFGDDLIFDPVPLLGLDPDTPFTQIDFAVDENSVGETLKFDISSLITDMLNAPNFGGGPFLSIVLNSGFENPGSCGFAGADRDLCSGIVFNDFAIHAVPTPAAILPTLVGLASAALGKKRDESDDEA